MSVRAYRLVRARVLVPIYKLAKANKLERVQRFVGAVRLA